MIEVEALERGKTYRFTTQWSNDEPGYAVMGVFKSRARFKGDIYLVVEGATMIHLIPPELVREVELQQRRYLW